VHKAPVHGGELPYRCPVCGLGKRSTGALSHHMKSAHNGGEKGGGRRTVTCEVCGKVVSGDYFTSHMKIHLEVKDKVCHFCGKAFVRNTPLQMHLRVHTGDSLSCVTCVGRPLTRRHRTRDISRCTRRTGVGWRMLKVVGKGEM